MPGFEKKLKIGSHLLVIYGLAIGLLALIWYFNWILGIVMTLFLAVSFYYSLRVEQTLVDETEAYISTLSHRVRKVGEEALLEMPIGIVLYNDDFNIEWTNSYVSDIANEDTLIGESLDFLSKSLSEYINDDTEDNHMFQYGNYVFQAHVKRAERLIYLFDRTEQAEIEKMFKQEQTVLAIIFLDNYDDITQNMEDARKSELNSQVTSVLNNWSHEYGVYLKRTSQDRFMAVASQAILEKLEKNRFDILDEVRHIDTEQNVPLTISIGVGASRINLPELGELAQSSLDLVLGRGGDQVAIKDESGKVRFYGGKTNPMEKRTRVRARVISHALRELVKDSDNVLIMGHQMPDMDSVGAAIGVLNIARANDVEGYVVYDPDDVETGVYRLIQALKEDDDIWNYFITPDEADDMATSNSLVVVVDVHKPSMVVHPRLLNKTEFKVVIDHHRRAEEFVENPTLVYMEPYASSTAELVTELLEYQPKKLKLKMLEATALLAGIIVDTKSFTLRTGSRTFDAASYLRSQGADTVLVQQFLKEDLDIYIERSKLVERAYMFHDTVAIAKGTTGRTYNPILIAQTADTLLTMSGVEASFVISERKDGRIGISARSLGKVNVQVIMEQMNGGGHLTNAATQIEDTTIDDVEVLLKELLTDYFEGGDEE
ncbi:DHH family phosphoesterase [Lentibacillus saliphilus]|uniref:DHH family phosphoesterase n=1 Tax=Lentibacillus saliphilus TaxID=2737028 RepID=UPI001C30B26A|nr:DHH family phosphoesterase [Lentibacillus saliphilus]